MIDNRLWSVLQLNHNGLLEGGKMALDEQVNLRLSADQKNAAEKLAKERGFDTMSELLRYLLDGAVTRALESGADIERVEISVPRSVMRDLRLVETVGRQTAEQMCETFVRNGHGQTIRGMLPIMQAFFRQNPAAEEARGVASNRALFYSWRRYRAAG
jgi:hypothetical protein